MGAGRVRGGGRGARRMNTQSYSNKAAREQNSSMVLYSVPLGRVVTLIRVQGRLQLLDAGKGRPARNVGMTAYWNNGRHLSISTTNYLSTAESHPVARAPLPPPSPGPPIIVMHVSKPRGGGVDDAALRKQPLILLETQVFKLVWGGWPCRRRCPRERRRRGEGQRRSHPASRY